MNVPEAMTDRRYWRSWERIASSPTFDDARSIEFPSGASLPPDSLSRRGMLKLLGASFALAGLAGCRRPLETIVPFVEAPENVVPGIPKHYATTMPLGTGAYGVLVESHEGRPTKIEGNALHPSSRGAASSWMQASTLDLYDPDRSRRVLQRGEGKLSPSSWEDFLEFWRPLAAALEAKAGQGLAVLAEGYTSPTLARLAAAFRERFPEALWVVHEAVGDENLFEGMRLAFGAVYRPLYNFERARKIVALDADFLLTESESLVQAKGFAAGRRVGDSNDAMSRLYVVESTLTLTGANADHRTVVPSSAVGTFTAALAVALRDRGIPIEIPGGAVAPEMSDALSRRAAVIADDLTRSPGETLMVAGQRQPPEVHALVTACNLALGAHHHTLRFRQPRDLEWNQPHELQRLAGAMRRGAVETLVVLGGNPVYTAPADLALEAALDHVTHTIHLGTHVDETAQHSEWHLPQAHFLESWSDARSADGSASVVQPLIFPLYEGRSAIELLGLLTRDGNVNGYGLIRDTWLERVLGPSDTEVRWNRTLHDGILEGSALPDEFPTLEPDAIAAAFNRIVGRGTAPDPEGLEIVFTPSNTIYDGRFANNAWLQEIPDPITKMTWDNAALVSPATAASLGVETGDAVRIELGKRFLEAPVFVIPGQAKGSIAIALGYGRRAAGRVGDGVGVDAYRLRSHDAPYVAAGARVQKTGRRHRFALTQEHWDMEGRDLVRESTFKDFRTQGDTLQSETQPKVLPLWQERDYADGNQWGMAIDLNACIGCSACVIACQSENNIPVVGKDQVARSREMHWLRLDRYFSGDPAEPQVIFQPVPCMHCENAPCEQVCPVAATVHDSEGLNTMVYNRCIGTRYCSNNCPYKVRRFNFFNYTKDLPETLHMMMNPDVTVRSRGVMEKCTYCIQRIHAAKRVAKDEGRTPRDGEVVTACQQTCPADAIAFGNVNDGKSAVSLAKRSSRNYVLLEELHHKPRTSYLAKIRNPNPRWEAV